MRFFAAYGWMHCRTEGFLDQSVVPLVLSWWHSSPKRRMRQSRAAGCSSVSCEMFSPGPFSLGWSCALESPLTQNLPSTCNHCWGILSVINFQLLCHPCQLLALAVSCSREFPSWFHLSLGQIRPLLPVLPHATREVTGASACPPGQGCSDSGARGGAG